MHFKEGSDGIREPIYREFENSSDDLKVELEKFLNLKNERERGSPYQKMELLWPHELLKVTATLSSRGKKVCVYDRIQ